MIYARFRHETKEITDGEKVSVNWKQAIRFSVFAISVSWINFVFVLYFQKTGQRMLLFLGSTTTCLATLKVWKVWTIVFSSTEPN